MRPFAPWVFAIAVLSGVVSVAPAMAARPTCDDLLSAVASGQSRSDTARQFQVTETRIDACADLASRHDKQSARREQFETRRIERGLPLDH